MKKKLLLFGGLLAIGLSFFASCSDKEDESLAPSSVDAKPWTLDENMNTQIKPGDNFALYCWGKWYEKTPLISGENYVGLLYSEAEAAVEQRMKFEIPQHQMLRDDFERLGEDADAINQLKQKIQSLESMNTQEEKAFALGESLKAGNTPFLKGVLTVLDGEFLYTIESQNQLSDLLSKFADDDTKLASWLEWALIQLGVDKEMAPMRVEEALSLQPSKEQEDANSRMRRLCSPEYHENLISVKQLLTRAAGDEEQIIYALLEGLGVEPDKLNVDRATSYFFDDILLSDSEGSKVVSLLECCLAVDLALASRTACQKLLGKTDETVLKGLIDDKLSYPTAKTFCDTYLKDSYRQKILDLMENLRRTFRGRIEKLDWMSQTTKNSALEKLKKMTFLVGKSDSWHEEGIPQLAGKSLYEDMALVRKSQNDLRHVLLSKLPKDEIGNFCYLDGFSVSAVNAFYYPYCNSVFVLPNIILPPFYDESQSDAMLYALVAVFGHEITHGFDDEGALFDAVGRFKNWWTVSDQMAFKEKTDLLVDCYNHLPLFVDSDGYHVNGEQTLGENIADLGGLEMSLQVYEEKLKEQGFYGEELVKQEKRFFQAYANIWRAKLSDDYLMNMYGGDVHAPSFVRVNGCTMNCDRWYELFDVKWGDMNYLKPEKRARIW